jgi:hypothetical protein
MWCFRDEADRVVMTGVLRAPVLINVLVGEDLMRLTG